MTEYTIKQTSRKYQKLNRQSLAKHVNAKPKTVWIRKNDLRGYVIHTALKAHNSNMWYLDSGCSRHMCGNKVFFDTVTKCDGGLVTFGDGSISRVVGKCNIKSQELPNLTNVLLVDGLKANLLSISHLCDTQYQVQFFKIECSIFDKKGTCVMNGARTPDNCYGITSGSDIICNFAKLDESELWHQRLSHVNFNDLSRLSNLELIRGTSKLEKITSCVMDHTNWEKKLSSLIRKLSRLQPLNLLNLFIWI